MLIHLLAIAGGFLVLAWSADRFVLGASAVAQHLGVPPLIIGLTVVGIGTSAPEMLVSALSAWEGSPGIAVGNAIGSNITNIGLILGATALAYPLLVRSRILRRELPVLLVVMAASLLTVLDGALSALEGGALLAGMGGLLVWLYLQGRGDGGDPITAEFAQEIPHDLPLKHALGWLALGMVLLLASSRLLVWAAVALATELGVPELVIGLTIVALGTSLPELAASMAAARKGEHDIAIGNVIGSNMFNLLGVMGLAALIAPHAVDAEVLSRDFPVMAGLTVAFLIMGFGRRAHGAITRPEGLLLVVAYLAYMALLYQQST